MRNKVFKNMTHLMMSATLILNSVSVLPIFAIGVASEEYTLNQEAIDLDEFVDKETYEEIISEGPIQEDQNSDKEIKEAIPEESAQEEQSLDEEIEEATQDADEMDAQSASERVDVPVSDFKELEMAIENAGNTPTTIIISDEIVFTSTLTIANNQEIIIRALNPGSSVLLIREENNGGRHFQVYGILTIEDIILDGNHVLGGVFVNLGGDFTMNRGEIRNNNGITGGGVSVIQGRFEMNEGVIRNNTAPTGGGVRVEQGTFKMNGGEISDNEAIITGGGIRVVDDSEFIMKDGEVSNNTAPTGGGVSVLEGRFEMDRGFIQDNQANSDGGGVLIMGVNTMFEMNGGWIRKNVAGISGGGVRLEPQSSFIMNDGTIIGNEVIAGGMGSVGGGVSASTNTTFKMYGGEISENIADNGGGVRIVSATTIFIINDGIIRSNVARSIGGGVSAGANTTSEMNGGTISENIAGDGGGVSIETNGIFTMHEGGIISGNQANNNGGGVTVNNATFDMEGGEINSNQASNNGGGIYQTSNGTINIHGGRIVNNTASLIGGGIYTNNLDRLTTSESVWFESNKSIIATEFSGDPNHYPDIRFANASVYDHVLNNYDINYPIEEALWFREMPQNQFFEDAKLSSVSTISKRTEGWDLVVHDTRRGNATWRVMAMLNEELTNEQGHTLTNALIYVDADGNETIMEQGRPIQVFKHTTTGMEGVSVNWDNNRGVLLRIHPWSHSGHYTGSMTWTLVNAP